VPLTWVLSDLTRKIFLTRREKTENLTFLVKIFQTQTQTQTMDGWPNPSHKKLTRPYLGQIFWPGPITTFVCKFGSFTRRFCVLYNINISLGDFFKLLADFHFIRYGGSLTGRFCVLYLINNFLWDFYVTTFDSKRMPLFSKRGCAHFSQ